MILYSIHGGKVVSSPGRYNTALYGAVFRFIFLSHTSCDIVGRIRQSSDKLVWTLTVKQIRGVFDDN